jgi:cysteine desulfurase / selenocysteine lyase
MSSTLHTTRPTQGAKFDAHRIRADFPVLAQRVNGKPLVYLDNAATSQKPQPVLDAVMAFYREYNANVHRGLHTLSTRATEAYENARAKAARFVNAAHADEIVFTRGTTESINLVAHAFGQSNLRPGDEVLVTTMEHHSNIVPWQLVCQATGATLKAAPIDDRGELMLDAFAELVTDRTRIVAVTHVSNALGTINPIAKIAALAHARGAMVLVDGAQAAPHLPIDVQALDADFYAFSGHKVFGPTGIGVLYGKADLLLAMPPYQGGGEMIRSVTFAKTTYKDPPARFEAGTPNIAGAIGLGASIDYVEAIGFDAIAAHERDLSAYAQEQLSAVPRLRLIGTAEHKAGVFSFVIEGAHAHDVTTILDAEGVAVRGGHHCAQPVMDRFGVPATSRASLAFYNTRADIDALVAAIAKVQQVFK